MNIARNLSTIKYHRTIPTDLRHMKVFEFRIKNKKFRIKMFSFEKVQGIEILFRR